MEICNECKRQFKNSNALKIHILHAHTDTYKNTGKKISKSLTGKKLSDEVKEMQQSNTLPDINGNEWIIHIDVEDSHPNGYPCLILDNEPRKEYVKI
jgi:hypothetical protein